MREELDIWTVYDHPRDYPDHYVARLWRGETPTETVLRASTLAELHAMLPAGLARLSRMEDDDPVIVETWF